MKHIIGAALFLGSFLIYPLMGYIAFNTDFSIGEKATYTTIAYSVSWASFFLGLYLIGPQLISKIKNYFNSKKTSSS